MGEKLSRRPLLVAETPDADQQEDDGKGEEDTCLGEDAEDTLAAQGQVEHGAHRPGGGEDLDDLLNDLREELQGIPAAAEQGHDHTKHDAEPGSLPLGLDEGTQHGAQRGGGEAGSNHY